MNNEAYLGLTSYYFTQGFKLVPVCLAFQQLTGKHTVVNIYLHATPAVSVVITDNATNVDLAMHLRQWSSKLCFGHMLQLAFEDGLKILPAVLAMLKSDKANGLFYHCTTKGMEKLKELQVS